MPCKYCESTSSECHWPAKIREQIEPSRWAEAYALGVPCEVLAHEEVALPQVSLSEVWSAWSVPLALFAMAMILLYWFSGGSAG